MTNWIKVKGFTITQNKDFTFRVRCKDNFRRYQTDKVDFTEVLNFCSSVCPNIDIQEIKFKMQEKWEVF